MNVLLIRPEYDDDQCAPHLGLGYLSASLKKNNKLIEITFVSKSFLQQQVRSMVGALKLVGEKKWTIKEFKNNFKSKKRVNCAPPAPSCGLYLKKVKY